VTFRTWKQYLLFSMHKLKKYVPGYSSQTWGNPSGKLYFASSLPAVAAWLKIFCSDRKQLRWAIPSVFLANSKRMDVSVSAVPWKYVTNASTVRGPLLDSTSLPSVVRKWFIVSATVIINYWTYMNDNITH